MKWLGAWCYALGCVLPFGLHATEATLQTDGLAVTFDSDWRGRPALQVGYQPQNGHRATLTAGMTNLPAPGRSNSLPPKPGQSWPTFGNYERTPKSGFVMPNEDAMTLCGVRNLIDWDAQDHAVILRVRPINDCVRAQLPPDSQAQYMAGNLTSYGHFSQLYGVFEVEAKVPNAKGMWPAFWLLAEHGGWPPEIDVVEQLGNDELDLARNPDSPRSTHVYSYNVIRALETQSGRTQHEGGYVRNLPNLSADYHRYAVDWTSKHINFYFDRILVASISTPVELQSKPMFWMLGLAVGGGWHGDWVGAPTKPVDQALKVRRVRVWQRAEQVAAEAVMP